MNVTNNFAKHVTNFPVPDRMSHLPRDRRGYPIFYGAFVDEDGTPHFTINDERKRDLMVKHDLCSICGSKLFRGRWFAGGPASAFHERGCYVDMPMHDECLHYALKICPYLAAPNWAQEIGPQKAKQVKTAIVTIDHTMIPGRPPVFVAVMAVGQTMVGNAQTEFGEHTGQYVKPAKPYRKVEYWRDGEQLPDDVGLRLALEFIKITT
jgi:hypothetical protein